MRALTEIAAGLVIVRFVARRAGETVENAATRRDAWKNTVLAGLANYIDAGSIVAGAAGLALWTELFGLSSSFVG